VPADPAGGGDVLLPDRLHQGGGGERPAPDRKAVFEAFKGVEAQTILSDKPIKIDPTTMNPDYPMYIIQIQKGGLYKIVQDVGLVKNDLQCG
jgi:hypothetical protein